MRHADRAAGRCDRDRRAGSSGAGAAVPHCPAFGQRHRAGLRRRQQPAGIFPADAGRAGHRRGRADGRGRDLPVPAGGAGAGRAAGRAGHDAGCGHTGARDGQARRLQLRSGAAPGIVAG